MLYFNKFIKRFTSKKYNLNMQQKDKEQVEVKKETGRWSKDEHEKFMLGIMHYGRDWKKVEEIVKTRTGSQVRSHAQKFFNKIQKEEKEKMASKTKKTNEAGIKDEVSESQREYGFSLNDEGSNTTPIQLVSFIQNQSREGKKINLDNFKEKLQMKVIEEEALEQQPQEIGNLQKRNSFKSMSNILSAYQTLKQQQKPHTQLQDESFLIRLTKKYKKLFTKGGDFSNLIDFGNPQAIMRTERSIRKRSFTLPEGVEGDEQALMERKKRVINVTGSANMTQTEKENYRLALERALKQEKQKEENQDKQ